MRTKRQGRLTSGQIICMAAVATISGVAATTARPAASWTPGGTPVCTEPHVQTVPALTTTSLGMPGRGSGRVTTARGLPACRDGGDLRPRRGGIRLLEMGLPEAVEPGSAEEDLPGRLARQ